MFGLWVGRLARVRREGMSTTSLICFIVSVHLSISPFVCSYAASLSNRSCVRWGSGAESGTPRTREESRILTDFLRDSTADEREASGASKSFNRSCWPSKVQNNAPNTIDRRTRWRSCFFHEPFLPWEGSIRYVTVSWALLGRF